MTVKLEYVVPAIAVTTVTTESGFEATSVKGQTESFGTDAEQAW